MKILGLGLFLFFILFTIDLKALGALSVQTVVHGMHASVCISCGEL